MLLQCIMTDKKSKEIFVLDTAVDKRGLNLLIALTSERQPHFLQPTDSTNIRKIALKQSKRNGTASLEEDSTKFVKYFSKYYNGRVCNTAVCPLLTN
jgi:hypothetical protein